MATYGPDAVHCVVLTFRDGLLAGIAHDLVLRATRVEVSIEGAPDAVSARVDASSLRVVTALRDGQPLRDALRPADRQEIEATIRNVVLRADRFPEIRFDSTTVARRADGYEVAGRLSMAGVTRELTLPVRREGDRLLTEVRLHQPDFGIKPYRAMMGALRVRADVVVRASLPAAAGEG